MNQIPLAFYRFLIMPMVLVSLPWLSLFNAKVREGLRLRRRPFRQSIPRWSTRPVWIHAASGEFEYAKPVIRELKRRFPDVPIAVTYFSPTFAAAVTNFPGVDHAQALPLDFPGPCREFVRHLQPRLLLIARTDLWPEMLQQCRRARIPVVLFAYTQKTLAATPVKKLFLRWILQSVQYVYCVAKADHEHLELLHLPATVQVLGDPRYDQVFDRLSHPRPLNPALRPPVSMPCLVAGSTWPEDESVLLPGLAPLLLHSRLKLILVPHEPTIQHLAVLTAQLERLNLKHALFSAAHGWSEAHVLVVDQTGVLAELYPWGRFAFVGGSFRKTVHSVMEALGAGCVTYVGPLHSNNREAVEFKALKLGGRPGLEVVHSAHELHDKMAAALDDVGATDHFSLQLCAEFQRRLGASAKLVECLDPWLNEPQT